MSLNSIRNFNRSEKIALLELVIKIACSDNIITKQEQKTIRELLDVNHLKISRDYFRNVQRKSVEDIISVFVSKSNLNCAYTILEDYANHHGVNPEHEGRALDEIKQAIENKRKKIKFNLNKVLKVLCREFSFLWGKENMHPRVKEIYAIIFTLIAIVFGSYWTSGFLRFFGGKTELVMPEFSAVLCGLLIYGALAFRNYMPRPSNFRNMLFCVANLYLLSIIAMHIIGRNGIEKTVTIFVFFALIILAWLGIKEVLGFVLLGFFILLICKLFTIDTHFSWRAYPFMLSAFMGLGFQSENMFDAFQNISGSLVRKPAIERELVKESLKTAGTEVAKAAKKTKSIAAIAAGLPPGMA
jgi:membrane-associated HD superfamily phosphohydrolase